MKKSYLLIILLTIFALVFSQVVKYSVDSKNCIGCTLCVTKCPVKAISMKNNKAIIDPSLCIGCGLCVPACPVKAISQAKAVKAEKNTADSTQKAVPDSSKKGTKPKISEPENTPGSQLNKSGKTKTADQNIIADKNKIEPSIPARIVYNIDTKSCIGCKICIGKCPVKAIEYKKNTAVIDVNKCIGCGLCLPVCPVKSISKSYL